MGTGGGERNPLTSSVVIECPSYSLDTLHESPGERVLWFWFSSTGYQTLSSASSVGEAAIQGEQTIDGPRGVENIPS